MEELENLYKLNKHIEQEQKRQNKLIRKQQQRGKAIDKQISLRLENVTGILIDLINTRNDDMKIVYSREKILERLAYRPKNVESIENGSVGTKSDINLPPLVELDDHESPLPQSLRLTPLPPIPRDTRSSSKSSATKTKTESRTRTPSPMPEQVSSSESTKSVTPPPIDNTNSKKIVVLPAAPSHSPLKITRMTIGDTSTQFKMAPEYFVPDDQESVLKDIICPDDIIDKQPYITVARYRTMLGESTDFNNKPLQLGANSVETLILALEKFSQNFDSELNFSKNDMPFQYSSQRAVCGMADFGSIPILLADIIPTAKFEFQMKNFDYDELAHSRDAMENFALDFCAAICGILKCEPDYVRLFSIEKSKDELKMLNLTFGLTTPVLHETEKLAKDLQVRCEKACYILLS
ncbi:unnamed protein product [Rotaria sp. Silwood2]|nr:unnamed protein product [Rotaria sp. Silwood2]CAF3091766.1 unnamed protein product [Rotaria sp. Silwood2]CAF4467259.1 unnamed protein product [Rotaria sp. Silwood2]CAF4572017.1 unnamed protein product [Rotaria sp. Silwood2]